MLGRDVQSVFPTESKKEHLKNALEHGFVKDERKFISETEVCVYVRVLLLEKLLQVEMEGLLYHLLSVVMI